jgi:ribosome recycling factor
MILMRWLREHLFFPYPTEEDRITLCQQTGLSRKQLRSWLTDARRRKIHKLRKSENLKANARKRQQKYKEKVMEEKMSNYQDHIENSQSNESQSFIPNTNQMPFGFKVP